MSNDRIFIGIGGSVLALRVIDGQEIWRVRLGGMLSSAQILGVALIDGRLYATSNGEVTCLDPGTGRIHWTNKLKGLGTGFVAVAGMDPSHAGAHAQAAQNHATQAAALAAVVATSAAVTS